MRVEFSGHAKRRARLYRIPETTVTSILNAIDLPPGEHVLVKHVRGIRYPLKIVFRVEENLITVVTNCPLEEGEEMRVYYDNEADALYIKLGSRRPDGVIEITEGVNLDTTSEGKIVGIEILSASEKLDVRTILSYELQLDKKLLTQRTP